MTARADEWYELEPDMEPGLGGGLLLAACAAATVYIAIVAGVAGATGAFYLMFPELGALAFDVFSRPRGHWSNSPLHLATTPVLTGAIGIAITRILPYGFPSVLLNVGAAMAVILGLRSPIAPAMSAGLLPLVLGLKSWWYPPGVMFGTVLLAAASFPWRALTIKDIALPGRARSAPHTPQGRFWMAAYFAFLVAAVSIVELTGLRFILFPPLAVIGFEMFAHPESCAWADQPFRLPVVCLLTACVGLLLHHLLGVNWMTAALSMVCGMAVLRVSRVHVPPALAVALLPMVMDSPTYAYPCSVGLGTLVLTLWFWCCRGRLDAARKRGSGAVAA